MSSETVEKKKVAQGGLPICDFGCLVKVADIFDMFISDHEYDPSIRHQNIPCEMPKVTIGEKDRLRLVRLFHLLLLIFLKPKVSGKIRSHDNRAFGKIIQF